VVSATRQLCIVPAPHRTTVSIEEKSVTVDALLARTNAGTLDEAIHGLERRRKIHVMGGADPLIRLIRGPWDLRRGRSASGELAMFATWDELKAAADGEKNGSPGDPALRVLVRLIQDRDRKVLHMCRRLEACVESPAAAQITVSTVHKAKGLEWPRVLMSSDFNQFVELEKGNPARGSAGIQRGELPDARLLTVCLAANAARQAKGRHSLIEIPSQGKRPPLGHPMPSIETLVYPDAGSRAIVPRDASWLHGAPSSSNLATDILVSLHVSRMLSANAVRSSGWGHRARTRRLRSCPL
jgi:hypothetical protein